MKRKKKQSEKLTESNTAMSSEVEAVRDIHVEELPDDNPSFDSLDQNETKTDSSTVVDSNSFSSSPFGQLMEQKDLSPPVFDVSTSTTCYTRFESTAKGSIILTRLSALLEQMKINHSLNKKKFFIRAKVILVSGSVVFVVRVYSHQTDSHKAIVEFRRRKGDSMQYRSIYSAILEKLSDLVIKQDKDKDNDKDKDKQKEKETEEKKETKLSEKSFLVTPKEEQQEQKTQHSAPLKTMESS
jgi:hypothetical protein